MEVLPEMYRLALKCFRGDTGLRIKDKIRLIKQFLVGKQRIYKAIEIVKELEGKKGSEVKTVFDIGAAIGETALPMLREFPCARLYCFEPFLESFERLKMRTKKFAERVNYFNFGLFNKNGEVDLYIEKYRDASSIIPVERQFEEIYKKGFEKTQKISVRRLDDIVQELRVNKIEFMKIDIEGVEKEVCEGGMDTLTNKVENLFVEISPLRKGVHSHDYIDVFELLHKAGFSLAGIYEDFFFTKLL